MGFISKVLKNMKWACNKGFQKCKQMKWEHYKVIQKLGKLKCVYSTTMNKLGKMKWLLDFFKELERFGQKSHKYVMQVSLQKSLEKI